MKSRLVQRRRFYANSTNLRTIALWIILIAVLPLLSVAAPTNEAQREDKEIESLAKTLAKKLKKYEHLKDVPAAILLRSFVFEAKPKTHTEYRNFVVRINDDDSVATMERAMVFLSTADIADMAGWIYRDGDVIRLAEESWRLAPDADGKTQTVVFTVPEVETEDLICFSVEANYESPLRESYLKLSDTLPVMLSRTRIFSGRNYSFDFIGQNLVKGKFGTKVLESNGETPIDTKILVVDIPADPTGTDAAPATDSQPYLQTYLAGNYNEFIDDYFHPCSWSQPALHASFMLERLNKDASKVQTKASALTAGLTTPAEKADALFDFVQQEIAPIGFFEIGRPEDPSESLALGKATSVGKAILYYSLCRAIELPVEVHMGRNRQMGKIAASKYSIRQFTDFVVGLKTDPVRYYAPGTAGAVKGVIPESLAGTKFIAAQTGLGEQHQVIQQESFMKAASNPKAGISIYEQSIKQQDWGRWVTLP